MKNLKCTKMTKKKNFFSLRCCNGGVKALGCCRFPKINTENGQQGEALQRYIHKRKRRHECSVCVCELAHSDRHGKT